MSDPLQHPNLAELELQLRPLSHGDEALKLISNFANGIQKRERQNIFNTYGALVRDPILYEDVFSRGVMSDDEDPFIILQGDIVGTESAYFLGERMIGRLKFIVVNSTCDLVPNRRKYAALMKVISIAANNPKAKDILNELLAFRSSKRMYLPSLPGDPPEILGNAVEFDGLFQIRLTDLLVATRYASLSLVGWRMFGSLIRGIIVRSGESEVKMRENLESL